MPDRPGDPPEFDWLYGKKQAPPPPDETESTRVIPRSSAASTGPGGPPPAPPPRPGATPTTPFPKRRKIPYVKIVLFLLVAWVAYLVAVPVIAWKGVDQVNATPKQGTRPGEQPGTTFLLVGSDSREGLSAEQRKKLTTGGDVGQRTDTIMLLHIGAGKPVLLSIPRDSLVPIPGRGTTKINAAFAFGGAPLLVRTLEQNTGVRIDHYVEIGFGGFVGAVDAVDHITICPTKRMVDPQAGLKIDPGCQQVGGVTALGYARSRKTDPALGDITRAKHQREVVSAIGDRVKSPMTVINPFRYKRVINAATTSLKVSEGTSMFDMARFARAMTKVNGSDGLTCSMPIRDLAVHWDTERALALLGFIKSDKTDDIPADLCLPTGLKK